MPKVVGSTTGRDLWTEASPLKGRCGDVIPLNQKCPTCFGWAPLLIRFLLPSRPRVKVGLLATPLIRSGAPQHEEYGVHELLRRRR